MKHMWAFLILIGLTLGASSAAILSVDAGAPVGGRGPSTARVYLPLVAGPAPTPDPGGWITLLQEGFETEPGPLWRFRDDNGADFGMYHWARRDCRAFTGSYSAWAVGGGADGALLPCNSAYPDNVASSMVYGPFSLADAQAATLRFKLRFDQMLPDDDFCWLASDGTTTAGRCLNAQPSGWTTLDLDLGDLDPGTPGVSVLGKPQVWVGFRFTSDGAGHASEGPYVDDVVIRKCPDLSCTVGAARRQAGALHAASNRMAAPN